jgi:hypothetical protein
MEALCAGGPVNRVLWWTRVSGQNDVICLLMGIKPNYGGLLEICCGLAEWPSLYIANLLCSRQQIYSKSIAFCHQLICLQHSDVSRCLRQIRCVASMLQVASKSVECCSKRTNLSSKSTTFINIDQSEMCLLSWRHQWCYNLFFILSSKKQQNGSASESGPILLFPQYYKLLHVYSSTLDSNASNIPGSIRM